MTEEELRLECLRLAISRAPTLPECSRVVMDAGAYYDFLINGLSPPKDAGESAP